MNAATSYRRVPAAIFAVLVGGLFVYAKSGGRFLAPARTTPAAGTTEKRGWTSLDGIKSPRTSTRGGRGFLWLF